MRFLLAGERAAGYNRRVMGAHPPHSRHQCLIYEGSSSRHLGALSNIVREKLQQNYQCLILNSPPMNAGLRSYLAAADIDVAEEIGKGSLALSSDQRHLVEGAFEIDRMMHTLEDALEQALYDGYEGLWACGDMTWEMGPEKDFSKLLEYEQRLEEFLGVHPEMSGICQYHSDTMPREALRDGMLSHRSIFVNETLSMINPYYSHSSGEKARVSEIDLAVLRLCESGAAD